MEQMILGKLNAMMTAVDVYARLPQTLTERVTRLATRAIVCTESLQVEVLTDRKEQKILYKITFSFLLYHFFNKIFQYFRFVVRIRCCGK